MLPRRDWLFKRENSKEKIDGRVMVKTELLVLKEMRGLVPNKCEQMTFFPIV